MENPISIGAVAYHPRVVTIWEQFRTYFAARGTPIDYVLYSNYERLVDAVAVGEVEIGWNTNTAYVALDDRVDGATEILGMRDLDAGFATVVLGRRGSVDGEAPLSHTLAAGPFAVGSRDSGHAAILPIHYLREEGVDLGGSCALLRFDVDLGKHGDTGGSERLVIDAVASGEALAGAVGEPTLVAFRQEGVPALADLEVIWRSPTFYHCNFTALVGPGDERRRRWAEALLEMSFENPEMRPAMELEAVRRWLPADRSGYESLVAAMREQGMLGG